MEPQQPGRPRIVLAILLVAAGVAAGVWAYGRSRRGGRGSAGVAATPSNGVDYRLGPVLAALDAPDGGTPCETAYNASEAFDDAAKKAGRPTPWLALPDRATYLARCAALPEQDQQCLAPRFAAHHHGVCDPLLDRDVHGGVLFEPSPAVH